MAAIKKSLNQASPRGVTRSTVGHMATEPSEVLRDLWRSQEQAEALDDDCEAKSCRRMTDAGVGFDEFAAQGAQDGTASQASTADLATAWRDRLKREGKYNAAGGTLRDLVMGPRVTGPRP